MARCAKCANISCSHDHQSSENAGTSVDPAHGTFAFNGSDGTFTFTPELDFNGTLTFKYKAKDVNNDLSNEATVTIRVTAVNDPPIARDDGEPPFEIPARRPAQDRIAR